MSLKGFLPLTFEYNSSSRVWSMPMKMVRNSGPVITLALALEFTRAISWIGTGSITSTSPESRAATRVASDPIGVKMISFRLCSGLRHQFGLALNTVLTPG